MRLFIIGNGFDLAHGLSTSYVDFRDYLEETNWEFLVKFEAPYGFVPESRRKIVEDLLWKDFETNLSAINEDEIIDGAVSMEMGLEGGDVDIESTLNEYWEDEYKYIKRLNQYISEWVRQIDTDVSPKTKIIKKSAKDLFLTFNYTLVLEKVYGIANNQILHIHGSVDEHYSGEPVIGHGDFDRIERVKAKIPEAEQNFWEKESSIYKALANYYERTRKDVDFFLHFHKRFFENMSEVEQINVIGHSWGDVDMPYFKEILKHVEENVIWNVYYFKSEEEQQFLNKALEIGIARKNINMINTREFYK